MHYFCCDERRREIVRNKTDLNGIEFLEVVDTEADPESMRQRILRVHLLKANQTLVDGITEFDVHIQGGTRITGINVDEVESDGPQVLVVKVDRPGDYSIYTLRIGTPEGKPLVGFDALLSSVDFSFKIECPTEFDCLDERICPADQIDEPEIDYLARDYASFRQLMLDRMSVVMPDWRERNAADLGIALIEVLAYTADHLSYEMDAIGMESTLTTARRRASARRHARLVDYAMHDGSNARAWVQIRVNSPGVEINPGTPLFSRVPAVSDVIAPGSDAERRALEARPTIFETMHEATLHPELNRIYFYTWGNRECCLPAGATSATLRGHLEGLQIGDVLVFVEEKGPRSGAEADADLNHRHAVRISKEPERTTDPIGSVFSPGYEEGDPVTAVDITEITWMDEDALPFPLCISAIDREGAYHSDISVALGNIVLVDHGRTVRQEGLVVPKSDPRLALVPAGAGSHCEPVDPQPAPPRFTPLLDELPLTMTGTTGRARPNSGNRNWERFSETASAAAAHKWEHRHVLPAVHLEEAGRSRTWHPRRDLLASDAFRTEFAVEVDPDGRARLRFGDDEFGMRPAEETEFIAIYRVGNGPDGNIGANALHHIVSTHSGIESVTNPLPARGGSAPESIEHVRRSAPAAFWIPQRAVTPEDYAEVAMRHWQVHHAVATERWTGSWYTIFLTVDRRGGASVTMEFETEIRRHLERFRMAGHDLEIDGPRFVWLEIELRVCVLPDYYRGDVKRDLLDIFSPGVRPDGRRGFFHPDNFTFNQPVYLSRIFAAAQEAPGVRFVEAVAFQRFGDPQTSALDTGELPIGRLEIARLDNDSSFPEHGVLRFTMEGGR